MLEAAVLATVMVFAGWFVLLYRFHKTLHGIDPELSGKAGKPSLFWTGFNGHAVLVQLMRRRDLADGRYAPLAGQARLLRIWALLMMAALSWMGWAYLRTPMP